jgi:hypothetical protein
MSIVITSGVGMAVGVAVGALVGVALAALVAVDAVGEIPGAAASTAAAIAGSAASGTPADTGDPPQAARSMLAAKAPIAISRESLGISISRKGTTKANEVQYDQAIIRWGSREEVSLASSR